MVWLVYENKIYQAFNLYIYMCFFYQQTKQSDLKGAHQLAYSCCLICTFVSDKMKPLVSITNLSRLSLDCEVDFFESYLVNGQKSSLQIFTAQAEEEIRCVFEDYLMIKYFLSNLR